mmetsp:Transcript_18380/g.52660  ORF Transcript_18380/g.52660 Transcript_18380/m.52660 type:complete len:567 (-) Transcript_18380:66-1766(-)|eukprot:CAMPEP_0170234974 /NCGR_PEP_ID=MMETSP0116_2-20130129/17232_1 /TAXON_ID=400756 /ORGANISM="Durinskia baltica, Strain CSIRO CS-38" /LENGTH=566 /DNA_ID=CAMNT_0010485767 /DNA_START=23 /DNA_END=1723 /DNA_ORIENTATION=-
MAGVFEFHDDLIEGERMRSKVDSNPKFKSVQDKDGKSYAQGVRLQTEKISLVNRRMQSVELASMEIQTMSPAEFIADEQHVSDESIIEFLRTTAPVVERELDLAWNSMAAFDAYEPQWNDTSETCEMTLQVWKEGVVDLQIASVAWNCTGSMLACSFGRLDTLGWCEISAPVCLWNAFRPQLVAGEPDITIEINGFVMCLAFHPSLPGLLAGGTYNGELMLWNTASGELDPLVSSSSIDDYFHREAIQVVQWIPADVSGNKADTYQLATVSCDGKVLIWEAKKNDLSYPCRGFTLLLSASDPSHRRVLGGRSLSFSPLEPLSFAVGCETGHLLLARRPPPAASFGKPQGKYTWKSSAVALLDQAASANDRLKLQNHVETYCSRVNAKEVTAEVVFLSKPDPVMLFPQPRSTDLESHAGAVTVVDYSPFERKRLLSGSVDGSVKIYDTLTQQAVLTFFPPSKYLSTCAVSAAAWSASRACVFAVAMEMGGVYIYDLMQSRHEPVLELPLTGAGSQRVTSLTFNPKMIRLLAVGDESGRVRVFRLPFKLSEPQKGEVVFLANSLGGSK